MANDEIDIKIFLPGLDFLNPLIETPAVLFPRSLHTLVAGK
jgi:hypothetical protein